MEKTTDNTAKQNTREESPWETCENWMRGGMHKRGMHWMWKTMMPGTGRFGGLDADAPPEIKQLFEEWLAQIEQEILDYVNAQPSIDAVKIAEKFKLSIESVTYILTRLARKGKLNFKKESA
jgi:hypothetical protein